MPTKVYRSNNAVFEKKVRFFEGDVVDGVRLVIDGEAATVLYFCFTSALLRGRVWCAWMREFSVRLANFIASSSTRDKA